MTKTFDWYDYSKVLSFNAVYNFIVGGRGIGKTYGAKKLCIRKWIRNGEEFVYLRRFNTEMVAAKPKFFADIQLEFPEYEFRVNGNTGEIKRRNGKWATLCHFMALSKTQTYKSIALPNVHTIIFDEFILEKGYARYLPSETDVFNGLYSTIDRNNDRVKVLFLANAVSIMNPYFIDYKINAEKEYTRSYKGYIASHMIRGEKFAEQVKRTRFGQFISSTEYGDYAIDNQFADNTSHLVKEKPESSAPMINLLIKGIVYSIWGLSKGGGKFEWYVKRGGNASCKTYTMSLNEVKEGVPLILYSDKRLGMLRTAFTREGLYFDSPQTRNAISAIFKR